MTRRVGVALAGILSASLYVAPAFADGQIVIRNSNDPDNISTGPSFPASGCSGAGLTWACQAGASVSQVNAVLGSATDGATITFNSGAYTWASEFTLSNSKGVRFICVSNRACLVASNGMTWGLVGTLSGANTKTYELNGFKFTGGENVVWFYAGSNGASMTGVKIVNNWFASQTADNRIILLGDNDDYHKIYGVVAGNLFTNASSVMALEFFGTNNDASAPSDTRGTANNMFFEDNIITITTQTNSGLGCLDVTDKASVVVRYNTYTNCLMTSHGVTHSWGPVNFEFYGNAGIVNSGADGAYEDGSSLFHHQGSGLITIFDNVFTQASGQGHSGDPINVTHYRSTNPIEATGNSTFLDGAGECDGDDPVDTNLSGQGGYVCKRQPGRSPDGTLHPMYVWNNRWSDDSSRIGLVLREPWVGGLVSDHIKANRDYFNAVSKDAQTSTSAPFDGTTGMGFGTLARRPSTCSTASTHASDAGFGGVGYFATDENKLYHCGATNTWTLEYTPYPYPHPAR